MFEKALVCYYMCCVNVGDDDVSMFDYNAGLVGGMMDCASTKRVFVMLCWTEEMPLL